MKVIILQRHLPHYRIAFFEGLKAKIEEKGHTLELFYSIEGTETLIGSELSWATPISLKKIGPFIWHRCLTRLQGADLVVFPQEMKYLLPHWLIFRRLFGYRQKIAYWGHGRNFQLDPAKKSLNESLKKCLSKHVDWWFAYNEKSGKVVQEFGFEKEKITCLQNTVDTSQLITQMRAQDDSSREEVRKSLGTDSRNIAVFTGGLYEKKRLDFLLDAAFSVKERVPDFQLIIIGSGPQREVVEEAVRGKTWIHVLGKLNDFEKVPYWAVSKVLLMPGLVGLVVVDSFALGVPMITTNYPFHSPEFDYLVDGVNGVVSTPWESEDCYVDKVCELLEDSQKLTRLRAGALASAKDYSMENMVARMMCGILSVLNSN